MEKSKEQGGYTKIPNDILEALIQVRISGEEGQCLWLLLRKIYGWHKDQDWLSNKQFAKATGLRKQNVNRAINALMKKGIVIKNDYKGRGVYGLQADISKWALYSKLATNNVIENDSGSNRKRLQNVIENDSPYYTKETKETITKGNPSDFVKIMKVDPMNVFKTIEE